MVLAPSDNFGFLLDAARRPGGHSAQAPSVKKPCPIYAMFFRNRKRHIKIRAFTHTEGNE